MASFSVKESDLRDILPVNTLKTRVPQVQVERQVAPAPPRYRNEVSKYIIRRSHDCIHCSKCAQLCPYGVHVRKPGYKYFCEPKSYRCIGPACENTKHYCVAACPKSALQIVENPMMQILGDYRWSADMILATWMMAETGHVPPKEYGFNYQCGNSGGGFDKLGFKFPEKPLDGVSKDQIDTSIELNRRGDGRPQIRIDVPWYGGGMSFGSVSNVTQLSKARCAVAWNTFTCTGEGGYMERMRPYDDHVITQVATGLFGVRYIKSIPSRIVQMPGTMNPRARFVDESGKLREEEFDLIVLAVGLEPSRTAVELASRLGSELNEYGFCATQRSQPSSTSRPGVFVGGAFQEPKDIPETVMQASGAAAMAMELLASARNTRTVKKKYPDEHDVTDEEPRIGVFVCHCGRNIGSVIDVERVAKAIEAEPGVVLATHTMFTCSDTSLSNIRAQIVEHRLNRIVVASCTPRTHEPLFRETMREAGLNPYLFEMANIRDQCSWVHSASPEIATQKATELVKMAVARSQLLSSLEPGTLAVDQKGLVIGGGLAGMTAALALANQGFKVHLVERTQRLGGHLHDIHGTLEDMDVASLTANLIRQVQENKNIDVYLGTDVAEVKGHIGEFHATLSCNGQKSEVNAGAVIVATGAEKAQTTKFLGGTSPKVTTQVELEKQLHEGRLATEVKSVVMIQCAGSRDEERPDCSRICCSMAVKNALAIKAKSPETDVFVLYRDIRTYGFRETYYKKAREAGVVFLRYTPEQVPVVSDTNGLKVSVNSPDFPEPIEIETDLVVLSTGIEADRPNNKRVSDMLKVPLNADGFYVEAHTKQRPVDFATEGIFLCGLAHAPKFIDETIAQAWAAAARAATVLSKTHLDVSPQVSYVDQSKCISCMTCVHACPYGAPFCNTDGKGQIEAAKCMGCGICASECPARAIQLNHFETDQFRVMIRTLFAEGNGAAKERIPVQMVK